MRIILLIISLLVSSQVFAIESWKCSQRGGLGGNQLTEVRIQKGTQGYFVYLTASSGDVGPQWQIKDELLTEKLECKFSSSNNSLYCQAEEIPEWTTVHASEVQIRSIDTDTGEDKVINHTRVVVSGSSEVLRHFPSRVLDFAAQNCIKN